MAKADSNSKIRITVNGKLHELQVSPQRLLLDVIREDLDLTGTKRACNDGECGSCIVLLGKKGVMSCLLPVSRANGKEILTIEGLAPQLNKSYTPSTVPSELLHPLQKAFFELSASQCGFCIPGMIMQSAALLTANPDPAREDVVKYLARNLCRCTGYDKIIDAVLYAARLARNEKSINGHKTNGHIVGQSALRLDTLNEITGVARYAGDLKMPGMLYAKVLRSPHHHARILSIDTSEAEKFPGVVAILRDSDVPGKKFMKNGRPQTYLFPEDKVRFLGEGILALAARSEEIAAEAIKRIKVEYEPLPAVLTIEDALAPNAPQISPPAPNVDPEIITVTKGDIDSAFAKADVVVEGTFRTPRYEHAAMEPEAALAYMAEDGLMTIKVPLHHSFVGRDFIADALAFPKDKVRIICPPMGGGFGSRGDFYAASVVALLALKTGKPVRITYTRDESILGSCKTPSYVLKYKTGATKDGKLIALQADILANAGSWAVHMAPTTGGKEMLMFGRPTAILHHATGPYFVPNVKATAREVCTNGPRSTPLRATIGPPLAFAYETLMDQIAHKLDIDPIEFRLKNALDKGSVTHYGQVLKEGVAARTTLKRLKESYDEALAWKAEVPVNGDWKRGIGLATGWRNFGPAGQIIVKGAAELNDDGSVRVFAGAVEKGQGVMTILAQIAAEQLSMPLEKVFVTLGDTLLSPYPVETNSSKTTTVVGGAVFDASLRLKKALLQGAAQKLEEQQENLTMKDGYIFSKSAPKEKVSFKEMAAYFKHNAMPTKYEGTFFKQPPKDAAEAAQKSVGGGMFDYTAVPKEYEYAYGYASQLAQAEVNVKTGQVKIVKVVSVCDPGKIINPQLIDGQVTGGVTFGLGFALREEFKPTSEPTFKGYGLSSIRDTPEVIKNLYLEDPHSVGPFGARGVAEMPVIAIVPAVMIAISDATGGARIHDLPARPERVLEAINALSAPVASKARA